MTNEEAAVVIWDVFETSKKKLDKFISEKGEGNPKVKAQKAMLSALESAGFYVRSKKWAIDGIRIRISKHLTEFDKVSPPGRKFLRSSLLSKLPH